MRNNIEYAFAIGEGDEIKLEELTPELQGISAGPGTALEKSEKKRLMKALEQASGNKGKAAEICNMSRATFWRKCKMYQLY